MNASELTVEERMSIIQDLSRFTTQEWFDGTGIGDLTAEIVCLLIPAITRNTQIYANPRGAMLRRMKRGWPELFARVQPFIAKDSLVPLEILTKYGLWGGEISYINQVVRK